MERAMSDSRTAISSAKARSLHQRRGSVRNEMQSLLHTARSRISEAPAENRQCIASLGASDRRQPDCQWHRDAQIELSIVADAIAQFLQEEAEARATTKNIRNRIAGSARSL